MIGQSPIAATEVGDRKRRSLVAYAKQLREAQFLAGLRIPVHPTRRRPMFTKLLVKVAGDTPLKLVLRKHLERFLFSLEMRFRPIYTAIQRGHLILLFARQAGAAG